MLDEMPLPHVFDVTEQDFRRAVVERSRETPVLVDFWAPWCGPCQVLGPTLEKIVRELGGALLLAKVNTDENPRLAAAFSIRSIPTVHLLVGGEVVDGFMGALPEREIRSFLEPHLGGPEPDTLELARQHLQSGEAASARDLLEPHLSEKPDDHDARLLMARAALALGDERGFEHHVALLPEGTDQARAAVGLRGVLAFKEGCGQGEASWRRRLATNPDDLDARHGLACCLALSGRHAEALESWLSIVMADNRWKDGKARKAMVALFGVLGPGNDLAVEYRKKLALYL
jgi:putative thioredoxin